jgi:spoIIIJ-associated protein
MSPVGESDPALRVRELLERILDATNTDATIEIDEQDEELRANLDGEDLGLLIGRHGQTIDAIQHLAYRAAYHGYDGRKRVTVDAAGYRDRRAELLQHDADEAAEEAIQLGEPVALDAMNAVERRVVHEYLRDREDIETYSEGAEPDRHLVIAPLKP